MRPIAFLYFNDFLGVCGDELLNQLQMRYMYGGQIRLPLTILVYTGAGVSAAHQHSKSIEGLLLCIKGLKIAMPSTAGDMKGLLKSAVREDNPVIILEHKGLILSKATYPVPDEEYTIPLGEADIKREGRDVTVVATQLMVHRALAAAETLQAKGISIEVIDPRTLVPFDKQTIIDSLKKTGRLVIMTEEAKTGSAAGEIMSVITEEAFDYLNAPVKRVCAPDTPVPFSPVLEKYYMPDEGNLIQAVSEII
jgi:pyruvate dehydrogenase E1 component beta subunit